MDFIADIYSSSSFIARAERIWAVIKIVFANSCERMIEEIGKFCESIDSIELTKLSPSKLERKSILSFYFFADKSAVEAVHIVYYNTYTFTLSNTRLFQSDNFFVFFPLFPFFVAALWMLSHDNLIKNFTFGIMNRMKANQWTRDKRKRKKNCFRKELGT